MENYIDFSEMSSEDEWLEYEINVNFNIFRLMAEQVQKLLDMDDSIVKLTLLINEKCELSNRIIHSCNEGSEKHDEAIKVFIAMVDNEIKKLESFQRAGILKNISEHQEISTKSDLSDNQSETKRFETILSDVERLELCNKIITESASGKPDYNKTFIGNIDVHTLMYLLGGNKPKEIVKIRMTTHQKVYDLLLSISNHKFKEKTCVPNFVKRTICPAVLLTKNGNTIKRLNENVPIK